MKNLIQILVLILFINCKAQTPVIPLMDFEQEYGVIEGAYYKDVENFLNNFEGTWIWQDANSSITFVIQKVEAYYMTSSVNYYEDLLIGEFKYIENGIVLADYLNNMSTSLDYSRNIVGNSIIYRGWFPMCDECPNNELRVSLHFTDQERPFTASLVLRHGVQWWNQQEFIQAKLFIVGSYVVPDGTPLELRIPEGDYLLLKQ